jgi:hypothetical protein
MFPHMLFALAIGFLLRFAAGLEAVWGSVWGSVAFRETEFLS